MKRGDIQKKLRAFESPDAKMRYLARLAPRLKGETSREAYRLIGDIIMSSNVGPGGGLNSMYRINESRKADDKYFTEIDAGIAYIKAGDKVKGRKIIRDELAENMLYSSTKLAEELSSLGEKELATQAYQNVFDFGMTGDTSLRQQIADAKIAGRRLGLPREKIKALDTVTRKYHIGNENPFRQKKQPGTLVDKVRGPLSLILVFLSLFLAGNLAGITGNSTLSNTNNYPTYTVLLLIIILLVGAYWLWPKKKR